MHFVISVKSRKENNANIDIFNAPCNKRSKLKDLQFSHDFEQLFINIISLI